MIVQIIGRSTTGVPTRWAVLYDDDSIVPELNQYLEYLRMLERPDNSIRAAAYDLRAYYEFLSQTSRKLEAVTNDSLAQFARWYRQPLDNVLPFSEVQTTRSRSTTNRALATITRFYRYLASLSDQEGHHTAFERLSRSAHDYVRPLVTVVDNVGNARRHRTASRLGPRLPRSAAQVKVLTIEQVHDILQACQDRRDRLLIMLAFTTGMRVGQILGLMHEDIDTRNRSLSIQARTHNPYGARSKMGKSGTVPLSEQVNRLYIEYMHEEYGYIDSPYVFIDYKTLAPSTYSSVDSVVQRLRRATGNYAWSMHTLRHTFVTLSLRAGVPIDVISSLVLHNNVQTTIDTYAHLDIHDLRTILTRHGVMDGLYDSADAPLS